MKKSNGQMVRQQVLTNHVTDQKVIDAIYNTPRESFVPSEYVGSAYIDADIPLGNGREVIEPMTLARLLQLAEIEPTDTVLDIGCATGYSSAVASHMAAKVYALECDESMGALASKNIENLGIENCRVTVGKLEEGIAAHAQYDVIVISGGAEVVPEAIEAQLKEGGRIVLVKACSQSKIARVRLGLKSKGVVSYRDYFDTVRRVMPGLEKKAEFEF